MEEIRCEEIRLELYREAMSLIKRMRDDWKDEAERYAQRLNEVIVEEDTQGESKNIEDHWEYARKMEYYQKYSVAEEVIKEMKMNALRRKQK